STWRPGLFPESARLVQAASQPCGGESAAAYYRRDTRSAYRNFHAVHAMPRRSLSLLSQRREENRTHAFGHRHCSMKKPRATLDRVLSKAGIASRTTTREWIEQGRVKVNGRVIRNPDYWVESGKDAVHLDGIKVREKRKIYVALNKPTGVVTSFGDKQD